MSTEEETGDTAFTKENTQKWSATSRRLGPHGNGRNCGAGPDVSFVTAKQPKPHKGRGEYDEKIMREVGRDLDAYASDDKGIKMWETSSTQKLVVGKIVQKQKLKKKKKRGGGRERERGFFNSRRQRVLLVTERTTGEQKCWEMEEHRAPPKVGA